MSPTTAFQILQGMETLSLRMDKHVANTEKVVEFLIGQEQVEWVNHPLLPDFPIPYGQKTST